VLWKEPVKNGFSSFTIAEGKAFTQMNRDIAGANREVCVALNASNGKELWAVPVGVGVYDGGGDSGTPDNKGGDGPRSTPTVSAGKVYVFNQLLVLFCLDSESGKVLWTKDLIKEHQSGSSAHYCGENAPARTQPTRHFSGSRIRFEQPVERWSRAGIGNTVALSGETNSLPKQGYETDCEAFGADRSQLLEKLAQRNAPAVSSKSWLLARSGCKTAYLGPCVSDDAGDARTLIAHCVQSIKASISWDLLSRNENAVAIAKDIGFTPQRHLTRMVRGKDLRGREKSIYALAGFELG